MLSISPIRINNNYQQKVNKKAVVPKQVSFGHCLWINSPLIELIKKINNLRCMYCGEVMLTQKGVSDIIESFKCLRGEDFSKGIFIFSKYLRGNNVYLGEEMAELAKKNPKKSIKQVVMGNVDALLSERGKQFRDACLDIHERLSGQLRSNFQKTEAMRVITDLKYEYKRDFTDAKCKNNFNLLIHNLYNIAKEDSVAYGAYKSDLFSSSLTAPAFKNNNYKPLIYDKLLKGKKKEEKKVAKLQNMLIECSTKNSFEIIRYLFIKALGTVEHIVPRSKGGSDKVTNLAMACYECNSEVRKTNAFADMLEEFPNMEKNIISQLNIIESVLLGDSPIAKEAGDIQQRIMMANEYIPGVIDTLRKESNGKLKFEEY